MTSSASEYERAAGPLAGRLILLVTAYAPVLVIIGLRVIPDAEGWIAVGAGVAGVVIWIAFLWWLPKRQPRSVEIEDLEFVDAEVTGYIVSILLPLVAVSDPSTGDWLAYGLCAVLILGVAFAAELWSVNPVTYAFRMRAARATVEGARQIVLVRGTLEEAARR